MITLQNLTVKDAFRMDDGPITLRLNDEFGQVINIFAQHAEIRGVYLIEDDNRYAGVITRTDRSLFS